jgi:hypothetical protein
MSDNTADIRQDLASFASVRREPGPNDLPYPSLRKGLGLPESGYLDLATFDAALLASIDRASTDPGRRQAARAILCVSEIRWTPMSRRYSAAADAYGLTTASGFTRNNRDRPSHYKQLLADLASTIAAQTAPTSNRSSEHAAADASFEVSSRPNGTKPGGAPTETGRPRRGRVAAALACAVVLVAVAFVWSNRRSDASEAANTTEPSSVAGTAPKGSAIDAPSTASATPTSVRPERSSTTAPATACTVAAAAPSRELSATDTARLFDLTTEFAALVADHECPAGAASRFQAALVQDLVTNAGKPAGVIIAPPSGQPLRFTQTQWATYREIAGRERPENAADFGGYPVSIQAMSDAVVVELDGGGVLVGLTPDHPHYWIPPVAGAYTSWTTGGGIDGPLGLPTSNPYYTADEWRQDFQGGYMSAPRDLSQPATSTEVEEAGAELESLGNLAGRVLRQAGGQAWYVDQAGIAHWIPDGDTWNCLGASDLLVPADVSGYAVWSLPVGASATCDATR